MLTGIMWTFVYKEVAICTCATEKTTGTRSLEFYLFLAIFYQAFGVSLYFDRCSMLVAIMKELHYCVECFSTHILA